MSAAWETEHSVTLDLRRMRSLLDGLTPEARLVVVLNLRTAYPYLNIDVLPDGKLRMEAP